MESNTETEVINNLKVIRMAQKLSVWGPFSADCCGSSCEGVRHLA
jgi:hypothetical protein